MLDLISGSETWLKVTLAQYLTEKKSPTEKRDLPSPFSNDLIRPSAQV
jgi:hypothetical protein